MKLYVVNYTNKVVDGIVNCTFHVVAETEALAMAGYYKEKDKTYHNVFWKFQTIEQLMKIDLIIRCD